MGRFLGPEVGTPRGVSQTLLSLQNSRGERAGPFNSSHSCPPALLSPPPISGRAAWSLEALLTHHLVLSILPLNGSHSSHHEADHTPSLKPHETVKTRYSSSFFPALGIETKRSLCKTPSCFCRLHRQASLSSPPGPSRFPPRGASACAVPLPTRLSPCRFPSRAAGGACSLPQVLTSRLCFETGRCAVSPVVQGPGLPLLPGVGTWWVLTGQVNGPMSD